MASPKEFVVNERAARANAPWLEAINSGRTMTAIGARSGAASGVNVTIPEGAFAGALNGATLTLLVDGKPIRAVVQSEFRGLARDARYATTGV
jgi:hypothetical protein